MPTPTMLASPSAVDQLVEIGERHIAGLEHQIGIRKAVFVQLAGPDLAGEVDQHGFQRAPADLDADAVDSLRRKPIEGGRRSALSEPFSHLLYKTRQLQPVDNVGDSSRRQICGARQIGLGSLFQAADCIEDETLIVMPNFDRIAAFSRQTGDLPHCCYRRPPGRRQLVKLASDEALRTAPMREATLRAGTMEVNFPVAVSAYLI